MVQAAHSRCISTDLVVCSKREGVNQTDALEQALALWIKSRGKRVAKQV